MKVTSYYNKIPPSKIYVPSDEHKVSNLVLPPKKSPLSHYDMDMRQAQWEDLKENPPLTPYKPIPFTPQGTLEKSVGLWNFWRNNVVGFIQEFAP